MNLPCKIIIAGVGGQGVVFLTELLVEAAMKAGIAVGTSEIHGLSQRGGSVVAGLTFGENTFGFVEENGADFLLGLEFLEAMRCINYLNPSSIAVIDKTKIFPHSVNSGKAFYPDLQSSVDFLEKNISRVVMVEQQSSVLPVMKNLVVLAHAASLPDFPVAVSYIEEVISESKRGNPAKSLELFRKTLQEIQIKNARTCQ